MNNIDTRPFYYSQVRVDPKNPDRVYFSSTQLQVSDDGGKTARQRGAAGARRRPRPVDRPERPRALGASPTTAASRSPSTRAATSGTPTNLPIGQFYEVSYDFAVPYNVCSGAQDNGAWCGPSRRRTAR